jgi:hypothetical protein
VKQRLRYYRNLAGPAAYFWAACGVYSLAFIPVFLYRGDPLWAWFSAICVGVTPSNVRGAIAKHAARVVSTWLIHDGPVYLNRSMTKGGKS